MTEKAFVNIFARLLRWSGFAVATVAAVLMVLAPGGGGGSVGAAPLPGAIWTSLADGSTVNANIYTNKNDVYLNGGPQNGGPGLPEGIYVFQVTDPSGSTLLSSDNAGCRQATVGSNGRVSGVVTYGGCEHPTGTDTQSGATTVRLMPYNDTPNTGGEYKVWITPLAEFGNCGGSLASVNQGQLFGFCGETKTDNFKVQLPPNVAIAKTNNDTDSTVTVETTFNWIIGITVTNGPTSAPATISDTIPSAFTVNSVTPNSGQLNCSASSGNNISCTLASGTTNGTYTVTVSVTAPDGIPASECTSYQNSASVTGGGGTVAGSPATNSVTVTGCPGPNLTLVKTDSPDPVVENNNITYSLTVGNNGLNATSGTVTVTDTLPPGTTYVSASGTGWSCGQAAGVVTCTRSDALAAGSTYPVITIVVTAPNDVCAPLTNLAQVSGGGDPGNDPDATADATTTVTGCVANLAIVKSGPEGSVTFGTAFSYTVTVTNTGNASASGVVVTDDLPDSLTGVSASYNIDPNSEGGTGACTVGAGNAVTCTIGTLAASDGNTTGAEPDVVVVTINATAPTTCQTLTNTAAVDWNEGGPITSNQVSTNVTGCPGPTATATTVPPTPTNTPVPPTATPTTVPPSNGGPPPATPTPTVTTQVLAAPPTPITEVLAAPPVALPKSGGAPIGLLGAEALGLVMLGLGWALRRR